MAQELRLQTNYQSQGQTMTSNTHDLYTDEDADKPSVICDSNGQVCLALCKRCGKGESELDAPCSPQPTAGKVTIPRELAERVQETMGEFLMGHDWRQQDMDTSDDFDACVAVAPKMSLAEFLRQPDEVLQPFFEKGLREAGLMQQKMLDEAAALKAAKAAKAEPVQQPERAPLTDSEERELFSEAMVEAGYPKPERGRLINSQFMYQREEDRFVGWSLARAHGIQPAHKEHP